MSFPRQQRLQPDDLLCSSGAKYPNETIKYYGIGQGIQHRRFGSMTSLKDVQASIFLTAENDKTKSRPEPAIMCCWRILHPRLSYAAGIRGQFLRPGEFFSVGAPNSVLHATPPQQQ